jgi:hypothetical protein
MEFEPFDRRSARSVEYGEPDRFVNELGLLVAIGVMCAISLLNAVPDRIAG